MNKLDDVPDFLGLDKLREQIVKQMNDQAWRDLIKDEDPKLRLLHEEMTVKLKNDIEEKLNSEMFKTFIKESNV